MGLRVMNESKDTVISITTLLDLSVESVAELILGAVAPFNLARRARVDVQAAERPTTRGNKQQRRSDLNARRWSNDFPSSRQAHHHRLPRALVRFGFALAITLAGADGIEKKMAKKGRKELVMVQKGNDDPVLLALESPLSLPPPSHSNDARQVLLG